MLLVAALLCGLETGVRLPAVPPLPGQSPLMIGQSGAPEAQPIISRSNPTEEFSRRWSMSLETSDLFATTRNPFLFLVHTKYEGPNPLRYRLATQILAGRYQLTEPSGWSFLRGDVELSIGMLYSAVLHGPEDYIVGALTGVRYNFVPKNSRWSPYIEMRFGVNDTNASHVFQGQQQDFTFTYLLGAGVRYQLTPRWKVSLGMLNQHESDLFMTNPNFGFNVMGVTASIERRF
jgi:hypothetical protein